MNVPFYALGKNAAAFRDAYLDKISGIMAKGQFLLAVETEKFEQEFARFCGTRHAVAVSSGTAALRLTLTALGIGQGDEVITAPNSYFATGLAIRQVGATPVFADIDPATMNLDPRRVAEAITPRTAAVVSVHLYGRLSAMQELEKICARHSIALIEDAAQAHGAARNGKKAGAFGLAGCFSFHPVKNLGAFGDAGAVTTNDSSLAEKLRSLRNYGQTGRYAFGPGGNNDRCDELQAAILRLKLPFLPEWNTRRRAIAAQYMRILSPTIVSPADPDAPDEHVFHLYVVRSQHRDQLAAFLQTRGIDCRIHYPTPLHKMDVLIGGERRKVCLPQAEKAADEILSLPLYPELTQEQITLVCEGLQAFQPAP